jgi:hypothetical protein
MHATGDEWQVVSGFARRGQGWVPLRDILMLQGPGTEA